MKKLSALCLALLLTACSDGGVGGDAPFVPGPGGPTPPPTVPTPPPAPPPAAIDAFFSLVLNMIGITNDTDDSALLDNVVTTSPEDTDPVPLT